jgi:hypothetical protein
MINLIPKENLEIFADFSKAIICWKFKILNLQNDYIHFQAVDQNFTVNCNTVRKIAVSISEAAVLVSARKNRATDSLQCRFRLIRRLSKIK